MPQMGYKLHQANLGTLALSGADAGSYDINTIALNGYLTVNIEPKTVNLSGTRLYDGTVDAAALILLYLQVQ